MDMKLRNGLWYALIKFCLDKVEELIYVYDYKMIEVLLEQLQHS